MNEMQIRTIPTVQLINAIGMFEQEGNQSMVNLIAKELAFRIWVPNERITFDELAAEFGYKSIEPAKTLGKRK